MTSTPSVLAVVVPCYNEADLLVQSLPLIHQAAQRATQGHGWGVRLILINDGSKDHTGRVLDAYSRQHSQVCVLQFTRNFGKEAALLAGLQAAVDCNDVAAVLTIDADLQHPPELVADMLKAHLRGFPVVEAVKQQRGPETRQRRWLASPFYHLFHWASGLPLQGQTDFKLLQIQVVQQIIQLPERARFYRGLVAWLGHPKVQIPFNVPPRPMGKSQWSPGGLVRYAWGNLIAFSTWPLRALTWLGAAGIAIGLVGAAKSLWDYIAGTASTGFTTVILLQILFGGCILLALGVIGQYLGRIYEELKGRPHYVLQQPPPQKAPDA